MVVLGPLGPVGADGSDESWLISHAQVVASLPESIRGDFRVDFPSDGQILFTDSALVVDHNEVHHYRQSHTTHLGHPDHLHGDWLSWIDHESTG